MNQQEILEELCYYDPRNPDCTKDEDDIAEYKERLLKRGKTCSCDNCFYGRTKLAEHILAIQGTQLSQTEKEDTDAAIMITMRSAVIQVISVGTGKELLHEVLDAPKGAWDRIWDGIKSIKSLKMPTESIIDNRQG